MAEENLGARINNIELLIQYMAQTQRELASNQELLTTIVQQQAEEIQLLRQIVERHEEHLRRYDETIGVMQGQIKLLLERLLGNSGLN
ncbi:MAG: hypothetical protein RMK91_00760 [Pseudanabaenaceae cyanobacterium SKYGB_i_bin29]|nr:hypothetical protein [Pseudanabaenaceae cyanobacterium SKYG29]MDW8420382.1 hypothetical protein [Pseudanabaenaceae cyanobacterium SKYGB_i_bin29]